MANLPQNPEMPLDPWQQQGSEERTTSAWSEKQVRIPTAKPTEFDEYLDSINGEALVEFVFNSKDHTLFAVTDDYYFIYQGGCYVIEIRINKYTKSNILKARASGSSSLPHLKTTLAIVLVQPEVKDHMSGDFLRDSFRLSPTGEVSNKVEIKFGKIRGGPFGGLERTEIPYEGFNHDETRIIPSAANPKGNVRDRWHTNRYGR